MLLLPEQPLHHLSNFEPQLRAGGDGGAGQVESLEGRSGFFGGKYVEESEYEEGGLPFGGDHAVDFFPVADAPGVSFDEAVELDEGGLRGAFDGEGDEEIHELESFDVVEVDGGVGELFELGERLQVFGLDEREEGVELDGGLFWVGLKNNFFHLGQLRALLFFHLCDRFE